MSRAGWVRALLCLSLATAAGPTRASLIEVGRDAPTLQAAIALAKSGDVVELPPGDWAGPVEIDRSIILRGRGGTLDGGRQGSALVIRAPGARVEGLHIRNSGEDVGRSDACIYIAKEATGAVVRDNELDDCAFGIWVHETDGAQLVGNRIRGRSHQRPNDRGNGIQLFNASHLVVRDNVITGARDGIYVSATEDSLIEGNHTSDQRFGVHYMYSFRNILRGNVSNNNKVGFALMESNDLVVLDNEAFDNQRNGLLFRSVQYCEIRRNRLLRNGSGMFFYSSADNVIEDNEVRDNELGLKVWAGTLRNRIEGNRIVGNRQQVFYVAAEDQIWGESGRGNYWGDYLGWDHDDDGIGDRPHRVDSFMARLLYRYPAAVLLMRSPALEMLSHLSERLPILRTPTVIDVAPLFRLALADPTASTEAAR